MRGGGEQALAGRPRHDASDGARILSAQEGWRAHYPRGRALAVKPQGEGEREADVPVCGPRGRANDAAVCPTGNTMPDKTGALARG